MRGGVEWTMSSTCVQGGLPRPLGGYQPNLMMEPRSPAPGYYHHPLVLKPEPIDEDRNDSGITSGSDFHSSSPGSENSQDYHHHPVPSYEPPRTLPNSFYPVPLIQLQQQTAEAASYNNTEETPTKEATTQSTSPKSSEAGDEKNLEDPLRRLQMAFEKNDMLPSPKTSEHSMEDERSDEEFDEQSLRIPKMNSHGKVKTFKCKQCDFVAVTKMDFWDHSKVHIKAEKLLTCPKCPFVTEYKHHLEYHLRNHFGSKPFKCPKCTYSCVNKSMLNSHMKSHSNIYQYRCADCSYAAKYCHSLKLHLRKYSHKPAMVLNADGTPNPLPIIDVYGTRRGPKNKPNHQAPENTSPFKIELPQFMPPQMQLPFPYSFLGAFANPLMLPLHHQQQSNFQNQFPATPEKPEEQQPPSPEPELESPSPYQEDDSGVLDLRKPDCQTSQKSRRKGRAFKLEKIPQNTSFSEEDEEAVAELEEEERENREEATNNNKLGNYSCPYCDIAFGDVVLYTMHMGYHELKDPFTCNSCGVKCGDRISFFLHIARTPHT